MHAALPRRPSWNVLARLQGWDVRRLTIAEIPAAQALLYSVYLEEEGWAPPANPSNLRADHTVRRFVDDFDSTANWVGLFDRDGVLAGVTRVIDPQRCDGLEIARYVRVPPVPGLRIGEANRVALRADCRGGIALTLLSAGGAWLARSMGLDYVIASTTKRVFNRAARPHGWVHLGSEFRYHPNDPEPVMMMGFDLRRRALLRFGARRLTRSLRRLKRVIRAHQSQAS